MPVVMGSQARAIPLSIPANAGWLEKSQRTMQKSRGRGLARTGPRVNGSSSARWLVVALLASVRACEHIDTRIGPRYGAR